MKGKILITFFVVSLLLAIIPYENVNALVFQEVIGFEAPDGVKNLPYNDGFLKTQKNNSFAGTSRFSVNDTYVKSGVLNFKIYPLTTSMGKPSGWFNLTYDKAQYLTGIEFWFGNLTFLSASGDGVHFIFYNETTQGTKMRTSPSTTYPSQSMMDFKFAYSGTSYYIQFGGIQQKVNATKNEKIIITVTSPSGYQTLSYVAYDGDRYTKTNYVPSNSSSYVNNCRIDRMMVVTSNSGIAVYLDDLKYNISDSYESTYEGECGYDLSSYQKIGIDNTPQTVDINGYQLMKIYNVYSNGYLMGVSLCVSPSQYAYDSNLANYTCSLLGFNLGSADCFSQDGFMYRLFWSANINLGTPTSENQQSGYLLYAQFFHTKALWGNTYWQVCMGSYQSDLDSDGNTYFKYGSTTGVPQTRYERDLGVSFYLLGGLHNASYGFTDRLGLHNYVGSNSTGFQYTLGQPEGIVCSYLLGNGAYSYKLEIYRNLTTLVKTEYNLQFPSGVIGYIPVTIGRYTFKLYNYHYTYNITAYVSGTLPDFFITTNPLMTSPFQSYDIFYKFYHAQGDRGIIGLFHEQSDCNNFLNAFQHIDIANNITTSTPYSSTATENEYLTLFINNSQKSPVAYTTHIIKNPNVAENYIIASSENIEITEGNPEGANITIYGTHLLPLCDIGIYIDGALKKSVKYEQVFSYDYVPLLGGLHNVSLRVMMNGTLTTLDYCMITVTIITPDDEEGGGGDLGGLLPPPYSYIMGAIITIALMILPSIALGKVGLAQSESLKYVPIFSGTLGFILSCLIGFFPWYAIFALAFVLILIIVVLYLSKNKSG
jgi:hypothetical protein